MRLHLHDDDDDDDDDDDMKIISDHATVLTHLFLLLPDLVN